MTLNTKSPHRFHLVLCILGAFLLVNALVRLGLMVFGGNSDNFSPLMVTQIMGVGLVYDLAAASYALLPFVLVSLSTPDSRWGRILKGVLMSALSIVALGGMLFTVVAEGLFWNEFAARFNFIAVDYLVYTREVVGNIHESYPIGPILGGIAFLCAAVAWRYARVIWRMATGEASQIKVRFATFAAFFVLPVLSFWLVNDQLRDFLPSASARELAGNGYYELARAFRNNDLEYDSFYATLPIAVAERYIKEEFEEARSHSKILFRDRAIEREIAPEGAERSLNVVLVSMESLGADYVGFLGGRAGLTPTLDRLSREGLSFTKVYATGLRTVRGLEALSLSIPPTPGHAVPMRKNTSGLQTVGEVFGSHGYDSLYLYGGYAYFDNMRTFFGDHGYTVIDRNSIPSNRITHESIWGVADEDLFAQTIWEIDERVRKGRRVFAHVMTTSNHRPFTYPGGRIDIPSGTGRDGAVKYADWAIGRFLEEAARKPWFHRTLFVFVSDHTSKGRGRTDLPPENYHIPFIIYSPSIVAPQRIDTLASQIDVGPTVLALLNMRYVSRFFGQDILTEGRSHQRAFLANYLTVGYMEDGHVVELATKQRTRVVDAFTGNLLNTKGERARHYIDEAIAHYQVASRMVRPYDLKPPTPYAH